MQVTMSEYQTRTHYIIKNLPITALVVILNKQKNGAA